MSGFIGTPSMQDIERLERRIAELERLLAEHTHSYRTRSSMGKSMELRTGKSGGVS